MNIFVIMPFSGKGTGHKEEYWSDLYAKLTPYLKTAANQLGYANVEVSRADSNYCGQREGSGRKPMTIMEGVVRSIEKADVVAAILTGNNANVYYELGMSDRMEKGRVMFLEKGKKAPFDISSWDIINYEDANREANHKAEKTGGFNIALTAPGSSRETNGGDIAGQEALQKRITQAIGQAVAETKGHRILWVNDYPSNDAGYIELLEKKGWVIDFAFDTKSALELMKFRKYMFALTSLRRTKDACIIEEDERFYSDFRKEFGMEFRDASEKEFNPYRLPGIDFSLHMLAAQPEAKVFVFCSGRALNSYGMKQEPAGGPEERSNKDCLEALKQCCAKKKKTFDYFRDFLSLEAEMVRFEKGQNGPENEE